MPVVSIAASIALLATSCSEAPGHAPITVDKNGFIISDDGVTVSGAAGVAPDGTAVAIGFPGSPLPPGAETLATGIGAPVEIKLDDGAVQPSAALTVSFELNGEEVERQLDAGNIPIVLLQSTPDAEVDVLEADWDASNSTLTAELPHLSSAWPAFLEIGRLVDNMVTGFKQALGITFPQPGCVGDTADFSSTSYKITAVTHDVAWPCIRMVKMGLEGRLAIDLHSNSPYPWIVTTDPPFADRTLAIDGVSVYPVGVLYQQVLNRGNKGETILLPGQTLTLDFNQYEGSPRTGALTFDHGVFAVSLIGFGLSWALEKFSPQRYRAIMEDAAVLDCMASLSGTPIDGAPLNAGLVADVFKGVLGCIGAFGSNIAGLIAGNLGAMAIDVLLRGLNDPPKEASFKVERIITQSTGGPAVRDKRCGPVTNPHGGSQLIATIKTANVPIECSEAEATFVEMLTVQKDRTVHVGTYTCGILGAAEAEQVGYVVTCDDTARGVKIVLGR